MLRELLCTLLVRCPSSARRLGLAHEHAAIAARHARVREAWQSHLSASREAILTGADRCISRRNVLVIGTGDCLDVPVVELAARFDSVLLADVVISPTARRLARRFRDRVRCIQWDATGVLSALALRRRTIRPDEAIRLFDSADPGPPPENEPDLVVSANCISQLGLVPADALVAAHDDDRLSERCAAAAAKRHLRWLAARHGVRVLLADSARLDVAPDGSQLKREDLQQPFGLRAPDRNWLWNIAPIPEWSPYFHRVHEVGAWFDGPG
jgi:hypothetical protein